MTNQWPKEFMKYRQEFLAVYDSIHQVTLSKYFHEDYPDDQIWKDKRLWFHVTCATLAQFCFTASKIMYMARDLSFLERLNTITSGMIILLIFVRVNTFYLKLRTFRQLYFKPEAFHCNIHRPVSSLKLLTKVMKRCGKIGRWCVGWFVSYSIVVMISPLGAPLTEWANGTNKTYDELIPMYPSVHPMDIPWCRKEIKYALDLLAAAVNTIPWAGFVIIYYTIALLFVTQHRILHSSLKAGRGIPGDNTSPIHLKLWIEDHALMRKMVHDLRDTVSAHLAATFVVHVFTVGLNMLVLTSQTHDHNASTYLKLMDYSAYLMYSSLSLSDLFINCWLSTIITESGVLLRNAIYESDWYTKGKPHHDFVLPLMICGKEIHMTGMGMIRVQLTTFIDSLRVAYSYFTILQKTEH